jgi:hypothetical protein
MYDQSAPHHLDLKNEEVASSLLGVMANASFLQSGPLTKICCELVEKSVGGGYHEAIIKQPGFRPGVVPAGLISKILGIKGGSTNNASKLLQVRTATGASRWTDHCRFTHTVSHTGRAPSPPPPSLHHPPPGRTRLDQWLQQPAHGWWRGADARARAGGGSDGCGGDKALPPRPIGL